MDREGHILAPSAPGEPVARGRRFAEGLDRAMHEPFERALRFVFEQGESTCVTPPEEISAGRLLVAPVRRDDEVVAAAVLEEHGQAEADAGRFWDTWTDLVLSDVRDMVYVTDVKARKLLHVSPGFRIPEGATFEKVFADLDSWLTAFHPSDRDRVREALKMADQPVDLDVEFRFLKRGEWRWLWVRSHPIADASGDVVMRVGLLSDITDRKHAAFALERTETLYRQMAEHSHDALWVGTPDGRLIYTNSVYRQWWSADLSRGRASHWVESVDSADLPAVLDAWEGFGAGDGFDCRYRVVRGDQVRWYREHLRPILDSSGRCYRISGIVEDVTEIRLDEEAKRRADEAQKAALIREVHHRIKNSLQGVTGLIERWADASPALRDLSRSVVSQLNSVAVVHGLQGRRSPNGQGSITLQELLDAIEDYLLRLTGVTLEYDPARRCPIAVDGAEAIPMALVVNEILMNAAKHRATGDSIQLSVRSLTDIGESTAVDGSESRDRLAGVVIEVRNPGSLPQGFDLQTGARIGTGLELARLLLPRSGTRFEMSEDSGFVTATLEIRPPLVTCWEGNENSGSMTSSNPTGDVGRPVHTTAEPTTKDPHDEDPSRRR